MCECYATIHDPVRLERFKAIYPNGQVPIVYPLVDGRGRVGNEEFDFYLVDKTRLTETQVKETAKVLAPVFKLSEEEILKDFANPEMKIPLKAEGVSIAWCRRHVLVALPDYDSETAEYDEEDEDLYDDEDPELIS